MTTIPFHSKKVEHTHECAHKQRGAMCSCGAWEAMGNPFAAEIDRAMSRGFDYSALAGGFDEGIHDDEEGD
jgi:hypothetical protein